MDSTTLVFRQFALPITTFDYMKDFQRMYERKHDVKLNNNQLLVLMLGQFKTINAESEEHGSDNRQ
jgi:hypothetical protein